jgi:hypothetical protein
MSVVFEGPLARVNCDVAGCASTRYIQAVQRTATDSWHPEKLTVAVVRRMLKGHGWARRRRNCGLTAHYIDLCPECAAKGAVR